MDKSPARKLIDTSYILLKDRYYIAADLMSRVDSAVLFTVSYNLHEFFPNFSKSNLQEYLGLRDLPNPNGVDLVNSKQSCYEYIESIVLVRALTKERWENNKYNEVVINNLVPNNAPRKEKRRSLKNVKAKCGGKISNFMSACRPLEHIRKIFRDERKLTDIPGSFVDTYFCKHFFIGLDWLRIFSNVYDFGIGPCSHVYSISEKVIKDVLDYKLRAPNYKLNQWFRKLMFEMYEPLHDLYWRG